MAASLASAGNSTGFNLQSEGLPFAYIAPKEGAFAWNQGYMLLKNAKNVEQAIEFVKFIATPEGSAMHAEAFRPTRWPRARSTSPIPKVSAFYKAAYPGDALSKLWWWPSRPASS